MAASRRNSPASLHSLLSECNGALSDLGNRASELSRLDRQLSLLLPVPLARHVRACAIRGGTLVLQTDSPVWSTRLRMEQQQLLAALRPADGSAVISSIRIIVSPASSTSAARSKPAPRISAATAEFLAICAESESDPALRAALIRLSRRT